MSSSEPQDRSVTRWIQELKNGSDEAANQLWRLYFQRLVRLAKSQLHNAPKRVSDEEDVAVCVFNSLCDGAERGRFEQLDDRDDLWKLLVVMTRYKSLNQKRYQRALQRGGAKVRGHSIVNQIGREGDWGFDVFFGDEPTPDFLVQLQEEQDKLLGLLVDQSHQKIAQLRWQGFSIDEIAEKLEISSRSVKRKLALVRETWLVELTDEDT